MNWRLAASLVELRNQINAAYPERSKVSDGSIGDASHSARTSDHNPNEAGVVCAIDVTHDPEHLDGETLVSCLVENRDKRLKYVIWNKRMCRSYPANGKPAWTWQPYSGINAHQHHVHISVKPEKALYDSDETWTLPEEETLPEGEPEPAKPPVESIPTETSTVVKEEHSSSIISTLAGNETVKNIAKSGVTKGGNALAGSLASGSLLSAADSFITQHYAALIFAGVLILLAVLVWLFVFWHKHKQQLIQAQINADPARADIRFE